MSLLTGNVNIARFHVASTPSESAFEAGAFEEIPAGAEADRPKSWGFVPMKRGAPYQVGARRYCGRLRIDEVKPDPVVVKDRYDELVEAEFEGGATALSTKRRKELKEIALQEAMVGVTPTRRYIGWVIDGGVLYIASTNRSEISLVISHFRKIGTDATISKTPWGDRQLPDMESTIVDLKEPGQSVWGCRFLRHLVGHSPELAFEAEKGRVALVTADTKATVTGEILADLNRYLEVGAEILSAKLAAGEHAFTLDGLSWWLKGLAMPAVSAEHWTDLLDARLEVIQGVFDLLERTLLELRPQIEAGMDGRAFIQESLPQAARSETTITLKVPGRRPVTATQSQLAAALDDVKRHEAEHETLKRRARDALGEAAGRDGADVSRTQEGASP